jgi:hypothetical protein
MLRFLTDQNFDNRILRGLIRLRHELDAVRVQNIGLSEAEDPVLLQWAAQNGRIVLTHDVSTMAAYAYRRVATGERMPGVFEIPRSLPIGRAIEDLILIIECSEDGDWEGRVIYLPL